MADADDYEEQEILVYADFEAIIKPDEFRAADTQIKIVGIDSDAPLIQVNGKIFRGSYDVALGTNVFFVEDQVPINEDKLFMTSPDTNYQFINKTTKVLQMKRIFVQPNENVAVTESLNQSEEIESVCNTEDMRKKYIVTKTYGEALNQFLKPNEKPPREIVNEAEVASNYRPKSGDDDSESAEEEDVRDKDYVPYEFDEPGGMELD